jgi:hypothetical protein
MFQASPAIERFFRTFESKSSSESNTPSKDIATTVSQFADVFMAANPQGTQAVRAVDFASVLPRRKQLFESLGHRSTELVSLRETRLDARFVMAATQWKMTFARDGNEPRDIIVDSVYIVDTGEVSSPDGNPRIVFYLASQDIMQVLKDRGIASA